MREYFYIFRIFLLKTLYFFIVIKYNAIRGSVMKDFELHFKELYEMFLKPQTAEDIKALLDDLCTYKEVEQMAQRAYAAKLFLEGKTYNEIIAETEISSTTLSRISRAIAHGSGGYAKFLGSGNGND